MFQILELAASFFLYPDLQHLEHCLIIPIDLGIYIQTSLCSQFANCFKLLEPNTFKQNNYNVRMYNFYLNKLFKLFIFLKEIIMIIKTHIKLILNINSYQAYNLFSKFYCRERESTCDWELKNTTPNHMNSKQSFTNHNDSSI